jgi:hypothetical protein
MKYMEENGIDLEKSVGKLVTLKGKLSDEIWQHMLEYIETHPHEHYFNLSDRNLQIVVYAKEKIDCDNEIEIKGKLIQLKGNKHPKSKVNESYVEYHLIADSWKCL